MLCAVCSAIPCIDACYKLGAILAAVGVVITAVLFNCDGVARVVLMFVSLTGMLNRAALRNAVQKIRIHG